MIDCRPRLQKYNGAIPSPLGEPRGDVIAIPLPVVYQDAPAGGTLLIALLTSVMISVAVTMVMTPKLEIGR